MSRTSWKTPNDFVHMIKSFADFLIVKKEVIDHHMRW